MQNTLTCRHCGDPLVDVPDEGVSQGETGPMILVYRCPRCDLKAVAIYEPSGGLSPEQSTFVQREVERLGSFFPGDYTPRGGFGRLR